MGGNIEMVSNNSMLPAAATIHSDSYHQNATFETYELHSNGSLLIAEYSYQKSGIDEITILRNNKIHMILHGDYQIVKVLRCGICSTDLARRFLPFPLPQITGHEGVVEIVLEDNGVKKKGWGVVEINDGHASHHAANECAYCREMPTQCPSRLTMGIDQLPGCFAPFLIVPLGNLIPLPFGSMSIEAASLIEPFAAALHAVNSVTLRGGDRVAVLGAGRLGLLILAALQAHRVSSPQSFSITTVVRSERHAEQAKRLGTDQVLIYEDENSIVPYQFEVVFDTTGNPKGMQRALSIALREIHLKSTHGQPVLGLAHLTEMVVDEIALIPFSQKALLFGNRENSFVYVAPTVDKKWVATLEKGGRRVYSDDPAKMDEALRHKAPLDSAVQQFDLAVARTPAELDSILRPSDAHNRSLVRAGGAILLAPDSECGTCLITQLVNKDLLLSSSRCGDFRKAIPSLLLKQENGKTLAELVESLVTHHYPLSELPKAMDVAEGKVRDGERAIKVLIDCTVVPSSCQTKV